MSQVENKQIVQMKLNSFYCQYLNIRFETSLLVLII